MAISPTRPDFFDGTSKGKLRVWSAPSLDTGASTIIVPGIKRVFSVTHGNRPNSTFTWTSTGAGGSAVVLTLTVTASSSGSTFPLVVYGQ